MKALLFIPLIFIAIVLSGCEDDENKFQTECDDVTIVDTEMFKNSTSISFELTNVRIEKDCMSLEIKGPGCDGSTAVMKLVDSGSIKESNPVQRDLRLILDVSEDCLGLFTKEMSFDLTPLRTSDDEILLNLDGQSFLYEY